MLAKPFWSRSRPTEATEPAPTPIGNDEDLVKELREVMARVAAITAELNKRGWNVFTCVAEKAGKKVGHAAVDRRQEL